MGVRRPFWCLAAGAVLGAGTSTSPAAAQPVELEADQLDMSGETAQASGNVRVTQGERTLQAERLSYDRGRGLLDLFGNVRIEEPGFSATAPEAHYNLQAETGTIPQPRIHLLEADAWLTAERMERTGPDHYRLRSAQYTACYPDDPAWAVRSSTININQASHGAHHWNTRLNLGGLPVFYTPYFFHYTDDARHTGFLMPTVGSSSRNGMGATVPFYWSIAPQADATLALRHMKRRGTMGQAEVRYLAPNGLETRLYGQRLPNDQGPPRAKRADPGADPAYRITGEDRTFWQVQQEGPLPGGLSYQLDAKRVSDPLYLSEFDTDLDQGSSRHLTSTLALSRSLGPYRLALDGTYIQDLVDFNDPTTRHELPRVTLAGEQRLPGTDIRLDLDSEYVYFYREQGTRTERAYLDPSLKYRLEGRYGYIEPRAGWHMTRWQQGNRADNGGNPAAQRAYQRQIPHYRVDAGSEVVRIFKGPDWAARHSVGPRLYYVHTPYRDQAGYPVLDTSEQPLGYGDLFEERYFSGIDRLADSQRITLALQTRLDLKTPEHTWEAFNLQVGTIRYLRDERRVTLSGTPKELRNYSNIYAELDVRPWPWIDVSALAEYDYDRPLAGRQLDRFEAEAAVTPPGGFQLRGRYRRRMAETDGGELERQTEEAQASTTVPVTQTMDLFGSLRHSYRYGLTLDKKAGVRFKGDCLDVSLSFSERLIRQAAGEEPEQDRQVLLTLNLRTLGELTGSVTPGEVRDTVGSARTQTAGSGTCGPTRP
jgi:LPS-assembly protein